MTPSSLSARRAWIEIRYSRYRRYRPWSLSARRAWIEITRRTLLTRFYPVALRKESVDRNHQVCQFACAGRLSLSARRAWIEIVYPGTWSGSILSLSARRAWIEIRKIRPVAPGISSLSARRAWIEICGGACARRLALLSLSARRAWIEIVNCQARQENF